MKASVLFRLAAVAFSLSSLPQEAAAQRIVIRAGGDKDTPKKIVTLDPVFDLTKLWTQTSASLETQWKDKGFKWASEQTKDRGMIRRERFGFETLQLNLFSTAQTVEEVVFQLKDGKLSEVSFAIWNKGDSEKADLNEADFNKIVTGFVNELNVRMGVRFQSLGKDMQSASKQERLLWTGKDTLAQLEYSGGKEKVRDFYSDRVTKGPNFQGEFIRLRLVPKPKTMVGLNTSTGGAAQVARADLSKKIQRDPNGDIFIPNIPMVDQGDKGYCAVATAARVLNYYGIPADQHEMAQVSGNEAGGGGTNPDEMEEAIRKLQGKYRIRFQQQVDTDFISEGKFKQFISQYNSAAKKLGKRVVDPEAYFAPPDFPEPEVMLALRGKGPIFDRFLKSVRENIDKGVPLLWGLRLGMYPENGEKAKQFSGGHMRLIIGYNMAKGEILFSDSWGAGHEKKRMASADASAATMGLYTILPAQ